MQVVDGCACRWHCFIVQVTAVCSDVEMVTGTRRGQLIKWRCDTGGSLVHYVSRDGEPGADWSAHDGAVSCVAVLACRQWLVSGSSDCTLRVWDLRSNLLLQTLTGHQRQVRIHTVFWEQAASPHPHSPYIRFIAPPLPLPVRAPAPPPI